MPHKTNSEMTRNMILCALFTALIAAGAFIRIPMPLVPFTLQFFFVILAGLLLRGKLGFISVLAYIVLGLIGFPIFTGGGGIGYLLKPTFGYIIGFALGALAMGMIAHKTAAPSVKRLICASFAGFLIIYLCGTAYFYLISNYVTGAQIGLWTVLVNCFFITAPRDIVFCVVCAFIAKRLLGIIHKPIRVRTKNTDL